MQENNKIREGDIYPTNNFGDIKVLVYVSADNILVRFLNTGNTRTTTSGQVRKGTVADKEYFQSLQEDRRIDAEIRRVNRIHKPVIIGETRTSRYYGDYEILEINKYLVTVRFLTTGATKVVKYAKAASGTLVDDTHKQYMREKYPRIECQNYLDVLDGRVHSVWVGMKKRCYQKGSENYKSYGAKGVTICDEWHDFTNFASWYLRNYVEGYEIDKDLYSHVGESKCYSPDTCTFLPPRLNTLLGNIEYDGVDYKTNQSSWRVRTYNPFNNKSGKQQRQTFGHYKTKREALEVYVIIKNYVIHRLAKEHFNAGMITQEQLDRFLMVNVADYVDWSGC